MFEIRIVACAIMLVSASIIDLRKREVSDKLWVGFGALGLILTLLELNVISVNLLQYIMRVGITAPIAYAIYKAGLFGGADAKALIVISILLPFYDMPYKLHGFTALTVLTNATILTLAHVIHNVIRNSIDLAKGEAIFEGFQESRARKALAFMMGFRTNKPRRFLFAMESLEGASKRFVFNPARYDEFVTSDPRSIWVTPALPFILYIALGFGIMIILGDLVAVAFGNLLHYH